MKQEQVNFIAHLVVLLIVIGMYGSIVFVWVNFIYPVMAEVNTPLRNPIVCFQIGGLAACFSMYRIVIAEKYKVKPLEPN